MSDTTWEHDALRRLSALISRAAAQPGLDELLDLVTSGVADIVGFQVAAVSLLQPGDQFEVVSVAGDDDARAQLMGARTPLRQIESEFAEAEHWGSLWFLPHDRLPADARPGWVSTDWQADDHDGRPDADAWHPEDTLIAPFFSASGAMVGFLSVDLPDDGRRPGDLRRGVLEVFAAQAGIAISHMRERAALAERDRLVAAVHSVVRASQQSLEVDRILADTIGALADGLRSQRMWVRIFSDEDDARAHGHGRRYPENMDGAPQPALVGLAGRMAQHCWLTQRPAIVAHRHMEPREALTEDEAGMVLDFIAGIGSHSLLLVPLGAATECVGYLVMTREAAYPSWSPQEVDGAMEVGRDLGRSVLNARLLERERHLVGVLQEADHAKSTLLSTVSHELKNPLTSILGHLEILRGEVDTLSTAQARTPADGMASRSLGVIDRNSRRLLSRVEELLSFSRLSDPDRPLERVPVDLQQVMADAVDVLAPLASAGGVRVEVQVPAGGLVVQADADQVTALVLNLASNAVKFSPRESTVRLSAHPVPDAVEIRCTDEGIGISQDDQRKLFGEFYRSSNPQAHEIAGTGLGLSIVKRIVERHGGHIEVSSRLGQGSTFTVTLPTAYVVQDHLSTSSSSRSC
ncbi:sensor histidine kinase [Flexivirga sp.]|uniref:sensor histidine kinase n=1 Tax=Flexivirga sp. TaxID=1962927 RepID=UPI003F814C42